MNKQSKKRLDAHILIEDGKLIPPCCTCLTSPWQLVLETLYTEFRTEDRRDPPKSIIPFDNERIVRILATNGKPITDKDFIAYGMATLVLCNHGTGNRYVGHAEDVFISRNFRGQGIGGSLMHSLIEEANRRELIVIWLTSNPRRTTAHQLYEMLGFQKVAQPVKNKDYTTNLYMLPLRPAP